MIEEKRYISLKKTIGWYSLLWLLFFGVCILAFYVLSGKNLFTDDDGLHQQYVYFVYTGIWIRRLLHNIFVEHIFEIPMWDMSIGMGADPIITIGVGSDPLLWISALVPRNLTEYAFNIVISAKMYCSGLAYIFLAHRKRYFGSASIAGALVYVFSSILYVGLSQASFLNLFILFPLLMIGVDRVWKKEGVKLYVIVLAVCVLFNSYFTFMMGLLVISYCIIRFFSEKKPVKELGVLLGRFLTNTILAVCIGVGPTLPTNLNLTSLDRFEKSYEYTVFSVKGIGTLLSSFFSFCSRDGVFWGISSVALISIIVLFLDRKENTSIKIMFILYSLSFLFPIIGSVFNGLNFSTERYIFGYILLLAYIVTITFENMRKFKGKVWCISLLIGVIYLVVTCLTSDTGALISGISLIFSFLIIGIINGIDKIDQSQKGIAYIAVIFVTCVLLSYSGPGRVLTSYSVPLGQAYNIMTLSTGDSLIDGFDLKDSRFDRIPYAYTEVQANSSMLSGKNGFDFYHSSYNSYINRFYREICCFSGGMNTYMGMRNDNYANILCGTRYIIREDSQAKCVNSPYSYSLLSRDGDFGIYESDIPTDLVHFYDDSISYDEYMSHNAIEKEDIMMRYCVISDGSDELCDLTDAYNLIDYEVYDPGNILISNDELTVSDVGSYMDLTFDPQTDSEIYLNIMGITGSTSDGSMYYQLAVASLENGELKNADFWVGTDNSYRYYLGESDILFSFGYESGTIDGVRVYFNTPGHYSLSDIKIYSRSSSQISDTLSIYCENEKTDAVEYNLNGNHINIKTDTDKDKYLYIAVPFSEGWRASVDGQKTGIFRANTAFMAVYLTGGTHTIELSYHTPYLFIGWCLTLFSLSVFLVVQLRQNRKAKQDVR